jgi:hypothetical protein
MSRTGGAPGRWSDWNLRRTFAMVVVGCWKEERAGAGPSNGTVSVARVCREISKTDKVTKHRLVPRSKRSMSHAARRKAILAGLTHVKTNTWDSSTLPPRSNARQIRAAFDTVMKQLLPVSGVSAAASANREAYAWWCAHAIACGLAIEKKDALVIAGKVTVEDSPHFHEAESLLAWALDALAPSHRTRG